MSPPDAAPPSLLPLQPFLLSYQPSLLSTAAWFGVEPFVFTVVSRAVHRHPHHLLSLASTVVTPVPLPCSLVPVDCIRYATFPTAFSNCSLVCTTAAFQDGGTKSQSIVDMAYTVMVDDKDEADKDEASDDKAGDGDHKDTPAVLILGATYTRALVPDERLFDTKATADDVLEGVEKLCPLLAASQPCFKRILKRLRGLPRRSPHFPVFVRDPETWSSVEPAIDQH
jgi:hypothetical protein